MSLKVAFVKYLSKSILRQQFSWSGNQEHGELNQTSTYFGCDLVSAISKDSCDFDIFSNIVLAFAMLIGVVSEMLSTGVKLRFAMAVGSAFAFNCKDDSCNCGLVSSILFVCLKTNQPFD